MTEALLQRVNGTYQPYTEHDAEALGKVKQGEVICIKFARVRNPGHHRKAFVLLHAMHQNQDKLECSFEEFYDWVKIKAGLYEPVFGSHGFYKLKSLEYKKMGQEEFEKVYQKIVDVADRELDQEWALTFA